jgi:hypothetical protein
MIWPLTGRTGSAPRRPTRRPAATTTLARGEGAEVVDALAPDLAAGGLDRVGERGDELARVDGAVAGDVEREPDRRGERGLGAAGLAGAQPLDREAELAPVLEQLLELLGLVAVAGDDERAVEVELDAELGAEAGKPVERAEAEARAARARRTPAR